MDTKVLLRVENISKKVSITSSDKPKLTDKFLSKWQKIVDLLSLIIDIPAALIMRINKDTMEVLLKSKNDSNPYPVGGKELLGSGLYCETVIGSDQKLSVDNALKYKEWEDNPDVELNMISYFGFPIKWFDNETFGTICVLDNKTNELNKIQQDLLEQFKNVIEDDLELLVIKEKKEYLSFHDEMTGLYNRRYFENEIKRLNSSRLLPISIIVGDMDGLKYINDNYGHKIGDEYIKKAAEIINKATRDEDVVARIGGDEYAIILIETDSKVAKNICLRIKDDFKKFNNKSKYSEELRVSLGFATMELEAGDLNNIFIKADKKMYENKKQSRLN